MPRKGLSSAQKKDEISKACKPDGQDYEIALKPQREINQSKKSSEFYSENHGQDIHIPAKSIITVYIFTCSNTYIIMIANE